MRADQLCTWNIVLQYLTVRGGEGRPVLYLEYGLAVSGGEGPQVGEEYPGEEHGYCVDLLHQFCLRCHWTEGGQVLKKLENDEAKFKISTIQKYFH